MRCPKDNTDLIEVERQGIEIDYCPTCKGVWLDRRELDELIARSSTQVSYEEPSRDGYRESRDYRDSRDDSRSRSKPGGLMGRVGELLDDDRDHDRDRRRRDWDDDDDDDRYRDGRKKKSRKRGMLGDLFDF